MALQATPRFNLPYLFAGQTQKEATINGEMVLLDGFVSAATPSWGVASPPTTPNNGDFYVIPTGATGGWAGKDGQTAYYSEGWIYRPAVKGLRVVALDTNLEYIFGAGTGTAAWAQRTTAGGASGVAVQSNSGSPTQVSGLNFSTAFGLTIASGVATVALSATFSATYAPLASPTFTGVPKAPTATAGTNTTQLATTAFVTGAIASAASGQSQPVDLSSYAPLASPALTGTPTAPTAQAGTNTAQLATTAFVTGALSGVLTASAASTTYAPLASPTFTGTPSGPTATAGTNTTQFATTAFVKAAITAAGTTANGGSLTVQAAGTAKTDPLTTLNIGSGLGVSEGATGVYTVFNQLSFANNGTAVTKLTDGTTAVGVTASINLDPSLLVSASAGGQYNLSATGTQKRSQINNAAYTILAADRHIAIIGIPASQTATLPAASAYPAGTELTVYDETGALSASVKLTIATAGSDTINGAASFVMDLAYGHLKIVSNGVSKWTVIEFGDNGAAWIYYAPTIGATSGALTTTSSNCRYKKVGKTVHFYGIIYITTNGTGSGGVTVTLPFAANNTPIFVGRENSNTGKILQALVNGGGMTVYNYDNTYPAANGATLIVSGTYESTT